MEPAESSAELAYQEEEDSQLELLIELNFDEPLEDEASLGESWDDEVRAGDLPTRNLTSIVVFEAIGDRQALRDLEVLDEPDPPRLQIVGRLTRSNVAAGAAVQDPDAPLLQFLATEWSVEYDELNVTVWASSEHADYRLLSPWAIYDGYWQTLERRTALAARSIALLLENAELTYKQLLRLVVGLNTSEPGSLKLKSEEMLEHGRFVLDQIENTDGLSGCRALGGLRNALHLSSARDTNDAVSDDRGQVAPGKQAQAAAEASDGNKRQRRAPGKFQFKEEPESRKRPSLPKRENGRQFRADGANRLRGKQSLSSKDRGRYGARALKAVNEHDCDGPEKPQTAYTYFHRHTRDALKAEAAAAVKAQDSSMEICLSFGEVASAVTQRWKKATKAEREVFEEIAAADRERYALEIRALETERARVGRGRKRSSEAIGMSDAPSARDDSNCGGDATPDGSHRSKEGEAHGHGRRSSAELGSAPVFPMDDALLIRKEQAYRAYLVASGRNLAPDLGDDPTRTNGHRTQPAFVYPPTLRPYPPRRLPPLPCLPEASPLQLSVELEYPALTRLLMLWDMCAHLADAFQLAPRCMPLHALGHALSCATALDFSLVTQLHCAMLRVIARDRQTDEEWRTWAKTVQGAHLHLTWPALMGQLLASADDFACYSNETSSVVAKALSGKEWVALTPTARVEVLGWLADRALQTDTIRRHLDRSADGVASTRKERATVVIQEEGLAIAEKEARLRLAEILEHSAAANGRAAAAQSAEAEAAQRATISKLENDLAILRSKRRDLDVVLEGMSLRSDVLGVDRYGRVYRLLGGPLCASLLLQLPESAASIPNPSSIAIRAVSDEACCSSDGAWEEISGHETLRNLIEALHPDGIREGPLRIALARVLQPTLDAAFDTTCQRTHSAHSIHDVPDSTRTSGGGKCSAGSPSGGSSWPNDTRAVTIANGADKPAAAADSQRTERQQRAAASLCTALLNGKVIEPLDKGAAMAKALLESYANVPPSTSSSTEAGPLVNSSGAGMCKAVAAAVASRLARFVSAVNARAANIVESDEVRASMLRGTAARVSEIADIEYLSQLPPLPSPLAQAFERLRYAILELEDRLNGAGACWLDHMPLGRSWTAHVHKACEPVELSAALIVLEDVIAPHARSQEWDTECAASWRGEVQHATTIAAVATCLVLLDDVCCDWETLEKVGDQPNDAKKAAAARSVKRSPRPPRARLDEADFARTRGTALGLVRWCSHSPSPQIELRAIVEGELFRLIPHPRGGWESEHLGMAPLVDLHGLTVSEVRGVRVTAWYEEEVEEGEVRDVPYSGVVIDASGCQTGKRGMKVRFDSALDKNGNPEVLNIGNDDEWLYGLHYSKPDKKF